MLFFAHRGACEDAPENTLDAFLEAARQGADGVELDAMVCGSGEVVVCHDEQLVRLAGLPWEVRKTPYQTLLSADVGTKLGFRPARIPLLEEVLEALPSSMQVNIELKCERLDDGGLSKKVCDLVFRMGQSERVLLSSFNPLCLLKAGAFGGKLRRGLLLDPDRPLWRQRWMAPFTSNFSLHPHFSQLSEERAERWSAVGYTLVAWTVNDVDEAKRMAQFGVDVCITNRPGALRKEIGQAQ